MIMLDDIFPCRVRLSLEKGKEGCFPIARLLRTGWLIKVSPHKSDTLFAGWTIMAMTGISGSFVDA